MSKRAAFPAALLLVTLAAAACSGGGATATGAPSVPAATPSPTLAGIAHSTGPTDIVLRFDEAGGFVPPEFLAAHVPYFTLYGDGTVVFVQTGTMMEPRPDGVMVGSPVRTAKLTEDQVQDLLTLALADGGLAAARAEYQNPLVADAPTAVFTINADGIEKTVSVVALGMEDMEPTADTAIKQAMAKLGERLRDFDNGASLQSQPYAAAAYRGVLLEQQGLEGVRFRDWPWTDVAVSDFKLPADPNTLPQAKRLMTAEEAAVLEVEGFENGIGNGIWLRTDDGKEYSFVLRPLLPEETE